MYLPKVVEPGERVHVDDLRRGEGGQEKKKLRARARNHGHGLICDERESRYLVELVEAEARAAAGGEEDDVVLERQPRPLGRRDPRHR